MPRPSGGTVAVSILAGFFITVGGIMVALGGAFLVRWLELGGSPKDWSGLGLLAGLGIGGAGILVIAVVVGVVWHWHRTGGDRLPPRE